MVVQGYSYADISRVFHEEKIPVPSEYARMHSPSDCRHHPTYDPYYWSATTLSYIIHRQEYMGHTVLRKSKGVSYKSKKPPYPEDPLNLTGLLYCADCGAKLVRHNAKPSYREQMDSDMAYDRNTTRGKLDILSGRFKDPDIEAAVVSVTQKLGRISDQSYADMYAVGQRRQEVEKGRSLTARIERAKVAADKHNAERAITPVKGRRGMEI